MDTAALAEAATALQCRAYHACCHIEERESRAGRWWVAALSFDFLQLLDGPEVFSQVCPERRIKETKSLAQSKDDGD